MKYSAIAQIMYSQEQTVKSLSGPTKQSVGLTQLSNVISLQGTGKKQHKKVQRVNMYFSLRLAEHMETI